MENVPTFAETESAVLPKVVLPARGIVEPAPTFVMTVSAALPKLVLLALPIAVLAGTSAEITFAV